MKLTTLEKITRENHMKTWQSFFETRENNSVTAEQRDEWRRRRFASNTYGLSEVLAMLETVMLETK